MYEVYILQSVPTSRFYIGYSVNAQKRLLDHNQGFVRSTKAYIPYRLVYTEECATRSAAMKREKEIKAMKGGVQFHQLLHSGKTE